MGGAALVLSLFGARAAGAPASGAPAVALAVQTDSPPASQGQSPCEWHVWPAAVTHTTYYGWAHGGAVDGNQRGIKGYPDMKPDALDAQGQARLLSQIDWHAQTSDPNLRVVIHQIPTGSDDDRKRTSRLLTDTAPCYRELIITGSVVEANVLSSNSVRIVALRKKFDGANASPVNFATMSMVVFQVPEKNGADFDARMRSAVQDAYLAAVNKFIVMQSFH